MKKLINGKIINCGVDIRENIADEEAKDSYKISELKVFLASTDFKVMPDYDLDNQEVIKARQLARIELRNLIEKYNLKSL